MRRIHLFEFIDLPWYPQTFRHLHTDFLQFVASLDPSGEKNLIPLFRKAMQHAGTTEIVDLCSGGTGSWAQLQQQFKQAGLSAAIKLTDKYPDPESVRKWTDAAREGIEYLAEPVDAMNVPSHLTGMRTIFEGFHHFRPEQAKSILQDAVGNRAAIGIFEVTPKPPLAQVRLLVMPLMGLVGYLVLTPFTKPRTLSRFFWSYLIPIVPLALFWDAAVTLLRKYSVRELKEMTNPLQSSDYVWETGHASMESPLIEYTYLLGYPIQGS